jgi:hypothetical protein
MDPARSRPASVTVKRSPSESRRKRTWDWKVIPALLGLCSKASLMMLVASVKVEESVVKVERTGENMSASWGLGVKVVFLKLIYIVYTDILECIPLFIK